MAANLYTNTMRYGFGSFSFQRQAMIEDIKPLSTKGVTNFEGFAITGRQPSESDRRILFKVDDKYYKLVPQSNGAGTPTEVTMPSAVFADIETVFEHGNTVGELESITDISAWVNKEIYPVIALRASKGATSASQMPTISIALKLRDNQDQFTFEETSAEYNIADNGSEGEIVSIDAKTTITGNASVDIKVAICENGEYTDWMSFVEAKNRKGTSVKFKATYNVGQLGGADSAHIDGVSIVYCTGTSVVTGDEADLITKTVEYGNSLHFAQAIVKHKPLKDTELKAYVSFRSTPMKREMINIGIGTGTAQAIALSDKSINNNSLVVYEDGQPIQNFDFNTIDGEISGTYTKGAAITASYEYNFEPEVWQEMTLVTTQDGDGDYVTSKFQFNNEEDGKTVSNIKISMKRKTGYFDEVIGYGNESGTKQLFVLQHNPTEAGIVVPNILNYSYDKESNILTVITGKGTEIKAQYNWIGTTQEIYGLFCGWAE